VSDSLQTKIRTLLDKLYGQHPTKPQSFFFEAVYEALPELDELDPIRVRQMVAMAFAQNEVDHASHAEETLRHLVARVRHEANRSPEYVEHVEQEHAQAVQRHAQANQRLDQIMRDSGERSL
jgi:septum formation topological specificity factor MinE